MTEQLHCHFSLACIGEGNGDLLQCSCLKNPRDGGAWWADIYGVAQSRTWLKRLSSNQYSKRYLSIFTINSQTKKKIITVASHNGNMINPIAVTRVHYHMWNRWPVQVRCMKQGTQNWCSGATQRDGVERELQAEFRVRGYMYTWGWFVMKEGKKHHNVVK